MYCTKCGSQIPEGHRFCRACGAAVKRPAEAPPATAPTQPAAAPATPTPTEPRRGGFWRRFLAAIIDLIVVVPVWIVLAGLYEWFAVTLYERTLFAPDGAGLSRMLTLLAAGRWVVLLGFVYLYYAVAEATPLGASLGKLIMRLRVTGPDGKRAGIIRSTVRTALKPVSALPLMFGFLMAGFTTRKQALHDIMSGALVVRR